MQSGNSGDSMRAVRIQIRRLHRIYRRSRLTATGSGLRRSAAVPTSDLIRGVRIEVTVEPNADPESRVTLSNARDRLNMQRVRVDWRLDASVKRTFDTMFASCARNSGRTILARSIWTGNRRWRLAGDVRAEGTWHHMAPPECTILHAKASSTETASYMV